MTLRYMLDTNTCILAIHAPPTSRLAGKFNRHAAQMCISAIVLAEMHFGAETSKQVQRNLDEVEMFVARLSAVLPFDDAAAAEYGRLRVQLKKRPIGPFDTLIAAHARSLDMVLVTNNTREFNRVPALAIEDWLT